MQHSRKQLGQGDKDRCSYKKNKQNNEENIIIIKG